MPTPTVATTTLNDLGKMLINEISASVTGGDNHVPASKDNFISWCMPGLPFEPVDFTFCVKGLGGGATAEEEKLLLQQAFNFANLIDFIPDVSGIYDDKKQEAVFRTSEVRLSHIYGEILKFAKVVSGELSPSEKAKLERFRGLLRTTKKTKDIVTEEEKEVTVEAPMLQAYNDKFAAYKAAVLAYNTKRIEAQSASGVEGKRAVVDWTNNAALYRMMVKTAMDQWVTGGYKNDVEKINAYINLVTQRDLKLWQQKLLEFYDDAKVSGLGPGQEFFYTTLIPGNFAGAHGWTRYECSESHTHSGTHSETISGGGSGGLHFGLFSIGGGASHKSSQYSSEFGVSKFHLRMELTQAVVSRPWFYPEFFLNRGWTLRKGEGWTYDQMPSDGAAKPSGLVIGYPTLALFARNIEIESTEFASAYSEFSKSTGASGGVGWGPFRLGGNYAHSESGRNFSSDASHGKISVPGTQIIGFVNHLIPKAPNPLPELKDKDFE